MSTDTTKKSKGMSLTEFISKDEEGTGVPSAGANQNIVSAYDDANIPHQPPFTAHLGNLPYNLGEEEIYKLFRELDVVDLKLPRDQQTNRLRGFGYVEFGTREDLIEALIRNEQKLRGRPIRITLSTGQGDKRGGDGDRRRDRPPAEDDGVDDWRTVMKPQGCGGGENQRSLERPQEEIEFSEDQMVQDPPPQHLDTTTPMERSGGVSRGVDRRNRGGGGYPSGDRQHDENGGSPSGPPQAPKERKPLFVLPRTVGKPVGEAAEGARSSIFGGAKPVDTQKREREIEEKLEKLKVDVEPVKGDKEETAESSVDATGGGGEQRDGGSSSSGSGASRERRPRRRCPTDGGDHARSYRACGDRDSKSNK